MTEPDTRPADRREPDKGREQPAETPRTEEDTRQGRRFSVGTLRGQARARVRYIEGNHPAGGCRFLG